MVTIRELKVSRKEANRVARGGATCQTLFIFKKRKRKQTEQLKNTHKKKESSPN